MHNVPKIVPVNYKTLVQVFEEEGFTLVRHEGSHMIYTKSGISRPVVIPTYVAIPIFIIKNCLRTGKISRERYLELIGQIH